LSLYYAGLNIIYQVSACALNADGGSEYHKGISGKTLDCRFAENAIISQSVSVQSAYWANKFFLIFAEDKHP
jgi:hypothetical protein